MEDFIIALYGCKKIYGPFIGNDGRQRCTLYFHDGRTSSRSYARLLLEFKLGRRLTSREEADHIDEDPTNDTANNIQPLTRRENLIKSIQHREENNDYYGFECASCGQRFILKLYEVNNKIRQSKTGLAFCSRKCSYNYHLVNGLVSEDFIEAQVNNRINLDQDVIDKINEMSADNKSKRQIARDLNISRNQVDKYLK